MTEQSPPITPAELGWTGGTTLPQWRLLEDGDRISFSSCVAVHQAGLRDPEVKTEANVLGSALLKRFGEQHGLIRGTFHCSHVLGGVALVERSHATFELHSVLDTDVSDLAVLASECQQLAAHLRTTLPHWVKGGDNQRVLNDIVYSAFIRVLSAADLMGKADSGDGERVSALAVAQTEVANARTRVGAAVQRQARFEYFQGALMGSVAMAAACTVLGTLGARYWSGEISPSALVASTIFGALGAMVSVFQRMSTGSLKLDFNAPEGQLLILGAFRPVVGAIFGSVVQFALGSGLFGTSATGTSFGVFALLGFVSGFSERFATDMVERAGQVIAGTQKDAPHQSSK
jgi:hypothetical protein